jgi:uncharacterized protein (UPF0276 family)
MRKFTQKLGLGVGWRPELALSIDGRRDLGFIEVLAEDLDPDGPLPAAVEQLRRRGMPAVPHGVRLSLGGAEPPSSARLDALARLAARLGAPLVSEHLAFVRAGGRESGHLLPLPWTKAALDVVVDNVRRAQEVLPVPLALENVASLIRWPGSEMDEASFLAEVLERADVLLLLDVENVYANARNHGFDPLAYLDRLPLGRLAYVHVAGGSEQRGFYHDTHTQPVPTPVLELLEELCARTTVPGVLLERDDDFPPENLFNAELDAIATAVMRGVARAKRPTDLVTGANCRVHYK